MDIDRLSQGAKLRYTCSKPKDTGKLNYNSRLYFVFYIIVFYFLILLKKQSRKIRIAYTLEEGFSDD